MQEPSKSKWRDAGDWIVGVLASPRALQWGFFLLLTFVALATTLFIFAKTFGFAEVMHWLVLREPAPLPTPPIQVEQFRSLEP